ncbi:MAG: response regulator [Ktedonobacterales bacterium]|nr:response regulator [Ktedonobacterales bacterium]
MARHSYDGREGQTHILIVADLIESAQTIRGWLSTVQELHVVGICTSGEEAIDFARRHHPDIILMDIDLPRMDGLETTAHMMRMRLPIQVILMSSENSKEIMQRAMDVGARNYLPKPLRMNEVLRAIHLLMPLPPPGPQPSHAPRGGHLVAVCGVKGGVGTSLIATNLAVAMKALVEEALLIDGRLASGDDHILLGLEHVTHSIEMLRDPEELDHDSLQRIATRHESGLRFLRAPEDSDMARDIHREAMTAILTDAREQFDVVMVDSDLTSTEIGECVLEEAQRIIIVTTPEITAVNKLKSVFEQFRRRSIHPDRYWVVGNRVDGGYQISPRRLEQSLGISFAAQLPDDGHTVISAINRGMPIVTHAPRTPLARALTALAKVLVEDLVAVKVAR